MRLATSLNMFTEPPEPAEHALERLSKVGFSVFDFPFCDWLFAGSPFVEPAWREWLGRIRDVADGLGVQFTQAHAPCDIVRSPADRQRMMELSKRSLEGAALLGIDWVVFHITTTPGALDDDHLTSMRDLNVDMVQTLLRTADAVGVGIALENSSDRFVQPGEARSYGSTPGEIIDLVDTLASRRVGVCWDTGHAAIQRLDQRAAIRALGPRLKALHIQDTDGRSDQHLIPFLGTLDFGAIISALNEIGYAGDFTYEVHRFIRPFPDELRDSAARLAFEAGRYVLQAYDGTADGPRRAER